MPKSNKGLQAYSMDAKTNCLQDNNAKLLNHQRHFDPITRAIDPNSHFFGILFLTPDLIKKALDPKDRKFQGHSLYNMTTMDMISFF